MRQSSKHASLTMDSFCEASLLRNELLCYYWSNVNNSTPASLIKCIADFYSPSEILQAREMLWDASEDVLKALNAKKPRRPTAPKDAQTAVPFAEDISTWMSLMANYPDDDH